MILPAHKTRIKHSPPCRGNNKTKHQQSRKTQRQSARHAVKSANEAVACVRACVECLALLTFPPFLPPHGVKRRPPIWKVRAHTKTISIFFPFDCVNRCAVGGARQRIENPFFEPLLLLLLLLPFWRHMLAWWATVKTENENGGKKGFASEDQTAPAQQIFSLHYRGRSYRTVSFPFYFTVGRGRVGGENIFENKKSRGSKFYVSTLSYFHLMDFLLLRKCAVAFSSPL